MKRCVSPGDSLRPSLTLPPLRLDSLLARSSQSQGADKISSLIEESVDREFKTKKSASRLKYVFEEDVAAGWKDGEEVLLRFERGSSSALTLDMASPASVQSSQAVSGLERLYLERGDRVIVSSDTTIFGNGKASTSSGGREELCIVMGEVRRIASNFVEVSCAVNFAKKLVKFYGRWKR